MTDSQEQTKPDEPTESLQSALESSDGIRRLGLMAGVKSLARNLATEDAAYASDLDIHQRQLWGDGVAQKAPTSTGSDGDEMDVMAARDVIFQQSQPPQQQPGGMPTAQALLMAAAIAAGAGGLGYGLAGNGTDTDTDTDTHAKITVGFGTTNAAPTPSVVK